LAFPDIQYLVMLQLNQVREKRFSYGFNFREVDFDEDGLESIG
jgi:hypothetical protein